MKQREFLDILDKSSQDGTLDAEVLLKNLGFADDEMEKIFEVITGQREFDQLMEDWVKRMRERNSMRHGSQV
jgi:hypothetical protein